MGKINLGKLEMPTMSVWVRKDEIELFKETFLSNEIVVEGTVQLDNKPKKFKNSEEAASHILEGVSDSVPSRSFGQNKPLKTINIDVFRISAYKICTNNIDHII